jgi:Arc/MetJ-type ribon-helix-helix transcriptional regulator
MSFNVSPEIAELVAAQMATGKFTSADDVLLDALRKQRELLQEEEEFKDDWPAIKEALDDIEAGDPGQPAEEVFEETRKKFSL